MLSQSQRVKQYYRKVNMGCAIEYLVVFFVIQNNCAICGICAINTKTEKTKQSMEIDISECWFNISARKSVNKKGSGRLLVSVPATTKSPGHRLICICMFAILQACAWHLRHRGHVVPFTECWMVFRLATVYVSCLSGIRVNRWDVVSYSTVCMLRYMLCSYASKNAKREC